MVNNSNGPAPCHLIIVPERSARWRGVPRQSSFPFPLRLSHILKSIPFNIHLYVQKILVACLKNTYLITRIYKTNISKQNTFSHL